MWSHAFVYLFLCCVVISARGVSRGGGSHSYPHSTGHSGFGRGQTHTNPHSTGNSGFGSVQTHTYPHSTGNSGFGSVQTHTYPQSTGHSGNSINTYQKIAPNYNSHPGRTETHNYHNTYTQNTHNYGRTEVHHHYHYNPPRQIFYGSTHHPVYYGTPPTYIYEYRNSGSRFDTLLTGLALYNLGKMSSSHSSYGYREYRSNPHEFCKLRIEKGMRWDYEETRIDCKLMSSFIWEAESVNQQVPNQVSSVVQTVSSSNGNLNPDGSVSNTVVTKTVTVTDALNVKGPSLQVMPGMRCYLMRVSWDVTVLQKSVDCGLLQTYAGSMYYNRASSLFTSTVCFLCVILHSLFSLKLAI